MYKAFYAGMDTTAPLIALGLFGAVFLGIAIRTLFFQRRADFSALAELPLTDEPTAAPRSTP